MLLRSTLRRRARKRPAATALSVLLAASLVWVASRRPNRAYGGGHSSDESRLSSGNAAAATAAAKADSCPPADRFFGECVAASPKRRRSGMMGAAGTVWSAVTAEKCASYGRLFGADSRYAFEDSSCPWVQGDSKSKACQYFCYYDDRYGIARINRPLWEAAQSAEADIWAGSHATNDRSDEIAEGFRGYSSVASGLPLGKVLEVGSGPYTQTGTLIDTLKKDGIDPAIESVDLVDPGIRSYLTRTPNCAYKDGKLRGYPVKTHPVGGEHMEFQPGSFDTVVSINVIEHCEDAFEYLKRMNRALRPGGLLIFHDRIYDKFWNVLHPVKHSIEVAGLHPLRIKRRLIDRLVEQYDVVMLSTDLTAKMKERRATQIEEEPIWLVAKKKQ